jgi:protein ImuA
MAVFKKPLNLAELRHRLRILEGHGASLGTARPEAAARLGVPAIDGTLPWGGVPKGCLHEVTGAPGDNAAHGFAAALLGRLARDPGSLLWCRMRRTGYDNGVPYGPGLMQFGLAVERIVFVEAERTPDVLWAMEEGLRAAGLVAVYGEGIALDLTSSRRLQLAAEASGKTALALTRPQKRPSITAATTRWRITALPSGTNTEVIKPRWHIALTRCRGGNSNSWTVDWDHAAHRFDLAAPLADGLLATATG